MAEDRSTRVWDLLIIGAGPAGLTCAIYAGRARLSTLVLDKVGPGGQVALNHFVENYPGFADGIEGLKLADEMGRQAERFGAEVEAGEVTALAVTERPFSVQTEVGVRRARAVVIAAGCAPRKLEVPGEQDLYQRGVSYCATCDGPLFSGKHVIVVGGGNSAIWEALFLTRFASKVTVIHRRDELRADRGVQERAFADPKIEFLWSHTVTAIVGEDTVRGVRARHVASGEEREVAADGVFVAVGTVPQTEFLPPEIARDQAGFVTVSPSLQSSVEGVFACGDVRSGGYRQIAFAVGDGALAYRSARQHLEDGL
jgi:thioredoxin reductase (NADPH)